MRLEIGRDGDPGRAIEWSGERPLVVGRGRDVDESIPDPLLSRRHCQLELQGEVILVADLGSANGTFLNSIEITRATLQLGDLLTFGNFWLRLVEPPTVRVERRASKAPGEGTKRTVESPPLPRGAPRREAAPMAPERVAPGAPAAPSVGALFGPAAARTAEATPGVAATTPVPLPPPPPAAAGGSATDSDRVVLPVIEGYELADQIGKGSFGTVYRARTRAGRDVAIKVLPTGPGAKQEVMARFLREIEATGQLSHPNLVAVLGAGEGEGFAYLVMEFVAGETLARRLHANGRLEPLRALGIARQIASGLEHAFSRGFVHRDVKPENILVSEQGLAKLCDFGLVKSLGHSTVQGLTRPGQGFGSVAYMPPEQVKSAFIADQRADVYSVGATLYHMVTGRRPFSGQVTKGLLKRVLEEMPEPILDTAPDVPAPVVRLVEKCLQKDAAARFQTPTELCEAIDRCIAQCETSVGPAYRPDAPPAPVTDAEIKVPSLETFAGGPRSDSGPHRFLPTEVAPPASGDPFYRQRTDRDRVAPGASAIEQVTSLPPAALPRKPPPLPGTLATAATSPDKPAPGAALGLVIGPSSSAKPSDYGARGGGEQVPESDSDALAKFALEVEPALQVESALQTETEPPPAIVAEVPAGRAPAPPAEPDTEKVEPTPKPGRVAASTPAPATAAAPAKRPGLLRRIFRVLLRRK